jgi:hypothetical protein
MEDIDKAKRGDLLTKFPLGYMLFTITESKMFVASQGVGEHINVNWAKKNYFIEMTKDEIILHWPDILIDSYAYLFDAGNRNGLKRTDLSPSHT